ncbi:MAG TPA: sodium/solute symporter [Ignavibacteria bacterium]|nr:sodium/solute symporter [Ignavibacteria bacterium]
MLSRIIIISLFCLLIVVIGIIGMRKTRSFNDYFLGGGKIGAWMTAFTYGTAYFSAVLFIGFAGQVGWNFGYSGLWIAVFNSLVGVLGVWWLMGHRIKKMSVEYKVSTLPEYLEKRYNSKALKLYSSIAIFLLFIPYSAAVFIGLSYLFKVTFNIDYTVALLFMGGFTGLYLVLGGYNSMTMIDVIFGAIMILGCIVLASATISAAGGLNELTSKLAAIDPKLVSQVGPAGFWNLFYLVFLTSVAPFAMPQLIQKFYAVRDKKAIRLGMVASTSFSLLIAVVAYFVGSTSRVFLTPENAPAAFSNGKPVYDSLMPELLNKVIPEYLFVIMLLLILSASMSTLAAIILISSSSVVKDFYSGFINKNASDNMLTNLMRVCALVFIIISVVLAYFKPASIVIILGISWGAIGAAFLGPFVWGLLWKRTSLSGAFISSVIGLGTCLVLYFTGSSSPQAGTIGMLLSFILCPLISLFAPAKKLLPAESRT